MKQLYAIMILMALLTSSVSLWSQEVVMSADSVLMDTDSVTDPEWYVAPEVRNDYIRAPKHATANACPIDSVCTFDIDSNLVSVTVYEYGDTTCTITWSVSADGSRIGQSKEESATTSTQSFTAKYTWDEITNDWKGTSKSEFVYSAGLMTTNTAFLWLNNAWIPNTRYTYAYDASNRETEYISYTCDETTNNLVPSKSRVQEWYDDTNKTLEILYTAHDGTSWSAGTKKVWDYDANANQTLYEYYSSYSNGAWLSSTKEQWAFNASNQQTLHEKYSYSDGDWTITLQENSGYDEVGNNTWIENYSLTNNVWKGSRKEEYTYSDTIKTATFFYTWNADSNAFIYRLWSINDTTVTPTEKCSYKWQNNQWVGTGTRTLTTKADGRETQKITQTWSSTASDWVNKNCTTSVYTGADKTHETIYKWQNDAWAMTSITRADISDVTVDGIRQIVYTQWRCGADSVWAGVQKDSSAYSPMGKKLFELKYNAWANNEWVPYYKIEYQYDELNREVMNSRMDWVNNKWKGHYLFEYGYDDQDRQTAYTYYGDWNSTTDSWIGSSKQDCAYASNGKYGQKTMYKWDYDQNQWTGLFQYFYTYDASNHEIEQVVQGYSDNEWINSQLYIHEYDGSLLLKNNEYRWVNGDWMMITRNESYYDDATPANLHQTIVGSWSSSTGDVNSYTDKHYFYTCAPEYYTIRFVNYDGTELSLESILEGETPSYNGTDPTKPADAQYTYTFVGWEPEVVAVVGDATYTAKFDSAKNSYTVTWLNEDGSEIDHETLEYGATPTHTDMDKEVTAEWTYTFAGWEPEIVPVVDDATYTAKFDSTKNSYTVTWLNEDGTEIEHETLEYGAIPAHADIDKESTYDYTYTFTGWEPEITPVTGDATYTATFDSVANVHTIYYRITVTADDAVHGEAGFVFADAQSATLLTDSLVASGTWIELRATAADDWHFEHWSDGDTHPVRAIEVTSDAQYIASFAPNCGDYASLPVVILYDWLMMLELRSIHAMGYTFGEEDITWYRVHGEPDRQGEGAGADDERLGTGSSFTIDQSLVNSGDYYATVDVSNSPAGVLCTGMMRSQIVHYTSSGAAASPVLEPALVRPHQPQRVLLLNPDAPTTVRIYDISGHLLHTMAEDGAEWMSLQAEGVAGCYQVVVQNGDQRTVLRYIVVQ